LGYRRCQWGLTVIFCTVGLVCAASAQNLPTTQPEKAGFALDRLTRLTAVFQQEVETGRIPGAVVLIARNGKVVYQQAFGYQNREDGVVMKPDSIFRIASMSKPITSVATMMLAEQGQVDIAAPVAKYLPELKSLKVDGELPQRPMIIQDLLRHTSGLVYEFFTEDPRVRQAYAEAKVFNYDQSLADMITKLASLPLAHPPGTTWDYSMSTDVLGRVVEVVSGMTLDEFVRQRITTPLQLTATGFYLSPSQSERLAEPQVDPTTGKRPAMREMSHKPQWLSGGGGMLSTASDYARFCQMLLNGGELDGSRLLSPKTITLMTSDQLPPGITYNRSFTGGAQDLAPTPEMGQGFGFGFAVRKQAGNNPLPGSVGDFSWAGAYGTYFWVDPKEKLLAILMVQIDANDRLKRAHYRHLLRYLVYQAMTELGE
jgi:CubicO group peptidase (beta-lactamase class C family)